MNTVEINVCGSPTRVVTGRNGAFWEGYSRGAWEPETLAVFERFIDQQHSYIDIGAWIGPTLLYGTRLAKKAYGIEPDPIAYAELAANMDLGFGGTDKVKLFNLCITPASGRVSFGSRHEGGDSMSSLLFSDGETRWTVDGLSFEDFIRQNGIDDCNFIKMDIEGGEYSVIPTMTEYLKKHHPTVCLSLHPRFAVPGGKGLLRKFKTATMRFQKTSAIIRNVGFYRHFYNPSGWAPHPSRGSFWERILRRLDRATLKPVVLLMAYLYGIFGEERTALVMTDVKWH